MAKKKTFKEETEELSPAAQEQALRTNVIKTRIEKSCNDSKCHFRKKKANSGTSDMWMEGNLTD